MEAFDKFSFMENPIAELEELCRQKGYAPPSYTLLSDQTLSFYESFIACETNLLITHGRGATEEMAKNDSAIIMLRALSQTPEWMNNPELNLQLPYIKYSVENQYATIVEQHPLEQPLQVPKKVRAKSEAAPKPDPPKRMVQIRATKDKKEGLKMDAAGPSSAGGSTKEDQSASIVQKMEIKLPEVLNPKKKSYMRLLELSFDEEYNISYVEVDEGSGCGERQCMLQLMPKSMPMYYGCGSSTEEARNAAARKAFKNFKGMGKK